MLKSSIPFLDSRSRQRVNALDEASLTTSSQRLAWPGILVEAGWNASWEVDDLTIAHHYLALNVADTPLVVEVKKPHGFRPVTLDPGSIWFCPAGEAFTHRVRDPSSFALVSMEPRRFDHQFDEAAAPQLRRTYAIRSPQIEHVVKALVVEADRGNPSGLPFVEALVTALILQLAQHAGVQQSAPEPGRGGLPLLARRRVLELIDARLEGGVSIAELAVEAGLSPTHFARAFKQSMGRPPHQYILTARLERARELLDASGSSIADVALRTGFVDQAHLTRAFKRRFGVTPGAIVRSRADRSTPDHRR